MDEKTKKEFIALFNEGFEVVVAPQLSDIHKELGQINSRLTIIEGRLTTVENRLDTLERKVDRILDNQLVDENTLREHDKKINDLESAIAA